MNRTRNPLSGHTHSIVPADSIVDGDIYGYYTLAERSKLLGIETGAGVGDVFFSINGALAVMENAANIILFTKPTTVEKWGFYIESKGTAGTTILDIHYVGGASIFTTQSNRPSIAFDAISNLVTVMPDITVFAAGDVLQLDIDQCATGAIGARVKSYTIAGDVNPTDISTEDIASLRALYDLTDGDNWTNNAGWFKTSTANDWFGVTVAGGRVTGIELSNNNLVGSVAAWAMPTAIETLNLTSNTLSGDISSWSLATTLTDFRISSSTITGDVSSWVLPTPLVNFYMQGTNISGDVSSWILPASLEYFGMYGGPTVSGDISGWVLPASLEYFFCSETGVTGDLSGWVLPASLISITLYSTGVSGDISGWVLPATLENLLFTASSVSGDISGWVLPSVLEKLEVGSTSVSGDIGSWVLPATLLGLTCNNTTLSGAPVLSSAVVLYYFYYYDCALPEATVDLIASRIYDRRMAFTGTLGPWAYLGGTNAAPSGTYADEDPPTTGKGFIYELENDPESEGFRAWTFTYTA